LEKSSVYYSQCNYNNNCGSVQTKYEPWRKSGTQRLADKLSGSQFKPPNYKQNSLHQWTKLRLARSGYVILHFSQATGSFYGLPWEDHPYIQGFIKYNGWTLYVESCDTAIKASICNLALGGVVLYKLASVSNSDPFFYIQSSNVNPNTYVNPDTNEWSCTNADGSSNGNCGAKFDDMNCTGSSDTAKCIKYTTTHFPTQLYKFFEVYLVEASGSVTESNLIPAGGDATTINNCLADMPNIPCPDWVHDQRTVIDHRDNKRYKTWHPVWDQYYWCAYDHDHGSSTECLGPNLDSKYKYPSFDFTASYNYCQEESNNGFKAYCICDFNKHEDSKSQYCVYIVAHTTTSSLGRVCARFHTVTALGVAKDNGDVLFQINFKADFGLAMRKPDHLSNGLHTVNCPGNYEKYEFTNPFSDNNEEEKSNRGIRNSQAHRRFRASCNENLPYSFTASNGQKINGQQSCGGYEKWLMSTYAQDVDYNYNYGFPYRDGDDCDSTADDCDSTATSTTWESSKEIHFLLTFSNSSTQSCYKSVEECKTECETRPECTRISEVCNIHTRPGSDTICVARNGNRCKIDMGEMLFDLRAPVTGVTDSFANKTYYTGANGIMREIIQRGTFSIKRDDTCDVDEDGHFKTNIYGYKIGDVNFTSCHPNCAEIGELLQYVNPSADISTEFPGIGNSHIFDAAWNDNFFPGPTYERQQNLRNKHLFKSKADDPLCALALGLNKVKVDCGPSKCEYQYQQCGVMEQCYPYNN